MNDPKDKILIRDDDGNVVAFQIKHNDGTPVTLADALEVSTPAERVAWLKFVSENVRAEDENE